MRKPREIVRRCLIDLKIIGWWPPIVAVVLFALYQITMIFGNKSSRIDPRGIEIIVPLIFGIQAAYLLAPDNEPVLELLRAYSKPLSTIMLERLLVSSLLNGSMAFLLTGGISALPNTESFGLALVRWIPTSIALVGVAIFVTQLTRQGILGSITVTTVWVATLFFGDTLLRVWPGFWQFHLYLQPNVIPWQHYALNRLSLCIIGLLFILLAVFLIGNDNWGQGVD